MEFGIPWGTSYAHVLIVGDMNLKKLKFLSLALSFHMKGSLKS